MSATFVGIALTPFRLTGWDTTLSIEYMKKKFDDGSYISWKSKESVMYVDGEFSVEVWVDYFRSGFFSTGRIIKYPSVMKWSARPEGYSEIINNEKRDEIIEKIKISLGHCKVIIEEINGIRFS